MKETSLFDLLLEEPQKPSGPVTCLGMTFENDEDRRAHFPGHPGGQVRIRAAPEQSGILPIPAPRDDW
ncbi:MAG: hypothetical protein WCY67_09305 [Acidithiobacillus sp.]